MNRIAIGFKDKSSVLFVNYIGIGDNLLDATKNTWVQEEKVM